MLAAALGRILCWIRLLAHHQEHESLQAVGALAELTHNWPKWLVGSTPPPIADIATNMETVAAKRFGSPHWNGTIAQDLRHWAAVLRKEGHAGSASS